MQLRHIKNTFNVLRIQQYRQGRRKGGGGGEREREEEKEKITIEIMWMSYEGGFEDNLGAGMSDLVPQLASYTASISSG